MKANLKLRRPAGSEIAFIEIEGDRRKREPETIEIRFPWGTVGVTRATDTDACDYWVHVTRNHPKRGYFIPGETQEGRIVDARLDVSGQNSADSNLGQFADKDLYHVALRIGPQNAK